MDEGGGRIAYQGVPGAFSEEAALRFSPGFVPTPFDTFADVFAAVAHGACERACLPVRNSLAGEVPEVAAALPLSGLFTIATGELPIRLQLLAPPGARLAALETAESHPMALKQCAARLEALGLRAVRRFDTAGAARDVAAAADPARAAVAGPCAALRYGLAVVIDELQDRPGNATLFAVVST